MLLARGDAEPDPDCEGEGLSVEEREADAVEEGHFVSAWLTEELRDPSGETDELSEAEGELVEDAERRDVVAVALSVVVCVGSGCWGGVAAALPVCVAAGLLEALPVADPVALSVAEADADDVT